MICRLCLSSLSSDTAVRLFETNDKTKSNLVTIIGKYLGVELTYDDNYSTNICQECCEHLEEFHQFRLLVEQKQSTLCNEFLEVECDVKWFKKEGSIEIDEANDESLMDLKNVPLVSDDMNELNEDGAVEEFASAQITDGKRSSNDDGTIKLKNIAEVVIASYMKLNCDLCDDFSVAKFSELKTHFKQKHRKQAYIKCCDNIYRSAWKLASHIRGHQNTDIYKCMVCNKSLRSASKLKIHMEKVHSKSEQLNKVEPAEPFFCANCKRSFVHERTFRKHMRTHESNKQEVKCSLCEKSFVSAYTLGIHIKKIHEDWHSHVCDICGKKYKFKPSFEKHLLEHQGIIDPAVKCTVCGKWSKNEQCLRLHQYVHDNENAKCDICGKQTVSRRALIHHIKYTHKWQKNLKCQYCDNTFKVKKNLEEHEATHTGVQLYSCAHCTKEFRSKSNMYVHVKRQHHEEWLKAKIASSFDPNKEKTQAEIN